MILFVHFLRLDTDLKKWKKINYSNELFFESSKNLTKEGVLIFLFPLNFCYNLKTKQRLLKRGITIKGIFFLEQGSHLPSTSIGSCLIVAKKGPPEKTFAANLSNIEANQIVYNNFCNSREGKIIELGKYVDFETFRSLEELVYEKQLIDNSKRTGFKPIYLSEIAKSINLINPK